MKKSAVLEKPVPLVLHETRNYRIVATPYPVREYKASDNQFQVIKYITQLVIEKKKVNSIGESYFSEVTFDRNPEQKSENMSTYGDGALWAFVKEMFLPEGGSIHNSSHKALLINIEKKIEKCAHPIGMIKANDPNVIHGFICGKCNKKLKPVGFEEI